LQSLSTDIAGDGSDSKDNEPSTIAGFYEWYNNEVQPHIGQGEDERYRCCILLLPALLLATFLSLQGVTAPCSTDSTHVHVLWTPSANVFIL
jgi:hypothetical protein